MTDSAARGLFGEYSQLFGSGNGESMVGLREACQT